MVKHLPLEKETESEDHVTELRCQFYRTLNTVQDPNIWNSLENFIKP